MKTAFITPLSSELRHFTAGLEVHGYVKQHREINGYHYDFLEDGSFCTQAGHGKTEYAIKAVSKIEAAGSADLLVCLGACGGLHGELSVGDIVVATETVEHDYKERFEPGPAPVFSGYEQVLPGLVELNLTNVVFGRIASGDEDIVDRSRAEQIAKEFESIAVAWEGAGGARAARHLGIPFLEVRVVTDMAHADAPGDFKANLQLGMQNLARFCMGPLRDSLNSLK